MTALGLAKQVARLARSNGGQAFIVGGAVRDKILGQQIKDVDLELYSFSPRAAHRLLKNIGRVSTIGKFFGVYLLHKSGQTIEVALPRRDVRVGSGHRGFQVIIDPKLSPTEAARRRDFTINAMMLDPLTGKILDPYHGRTDLRNKVLRAVDIRFLGDDPLRLQRAFQFAARFNLRPDSRTMSALCELVRRRAELPGERKRAEWEKLISAPYPSVGLRLAAATGYFSNRRFFKGPANGRLVDRVVKISRTERVSRVELLRLFFSAVFQESMLAQQKPTKKWLTDEGFPALSVAQLTKLWSLSKKPAAMKKKSLKREIRLLAISAWPLTLREVVILGAARKNSVTLIKSIRRAAEKFWTKRPEPLISGKMMRAKNWPPGRIYHRVQLAAEKSFASGITLGVIKKTFRGSSDPEKFILSLLRLRP